MTLISSHSISYKFFMSVGQILQLIWWNWYSHLLISSYSLLAFGTSFQVLWNTGSKDTFVPLLRVFHMTGNLSIEATLPFPNFKGVTVSRIYWLVAILFISYVFINLSCYISTFWQVVWRNTYTCICYVISYANTYTYIYMYIYTAMGSILQLNPTSFIASSSRIITTNQRRSKALHDVTWDHRMNQPHAKRESSRAYAWVVPHKHISTLLRHVTDKAPTNKICSRAPLASY